MKYHFVYGQQGVGKTTAIGRLYKAILALGGKTLEFRHLFDEDFQAIVSYLDKKIAIYSSGDECQHLQTAIEYAMSNGCEILVAAVRKATHYNTVLDALGISRDDVRWHEFSDADGVPACHRTQNEKIIEIIIEISQ